MTRRITRRQAIAVAGIGSLVSSASAFGQSSAESVRVTIDPRRFASIHRQVVDDIAKAAEGTRLVTAEGHDRLLKLLESAKAVKGDGSAMLARLRDAIYKATSPEAMQSEIRKLAEAAAKADPLTAVIVLIAQDSIEYAMQQAKELKLTRLDAARAIFIVGSDVTGAITGAILGTKLGIPAIIAVAALAGAATGSSYAYMQTATPPPPPAQRGGR
jgi:hypothetical protein